MSPSRLPALYLPTRQPLSPAVMRGLDEWLPDAVQAPPPLAAAAIWQGLMSAYPQGRAAAGYALGWLWYGWRMALAPAAWQAIAQEASELMPSADYLAWRADIQRLQALPLYAAPRARWQSPDELRREAQIIAYLRGGRSVTR
ncbi:hypothetical protein [Halothiobacillus sp. DCM-1]|uniref:hypothetical protein n=1 Tax=Halothiobacillus sp. DCM-1 TaxID=3112558 RepID=UPI00324933C4